MAPHEQRNHKTVPKIDREPVTGNYKDGWQRVVYQLPTRHSGEGRPDSIGAQTVILPLDIDTLPGSIRSNRLMRHTLLYRHGVSRDLLKLTDAAKVHKSLFGWDIVGLGARGMWSRTDSSRNNFSHDHPC